MYVLIIQVLDSKSVIGFCVKFERRTLLFDEVRVS